MQSRQSCAKCNTSCNIQKIKNYEQTMRIFELKASVNIYKRSWRGIRIKMTRKRFRKELQCVLRREYFRIFSNVARNQRKKIKIIVPKSILN